LQAKLSGAAFFDINHDGKREPSEPGVAGISVDYSGGKSGALTTDANGTFSAEVPADPAYQTSTYTISAKPPARSAWMSTSAALTLTLPDPNGVNLGVACTTRARGGESAKYWASSKGKAVLNAHNPVWQGLLNSKFQLNLPATPNEAYAQFQKSLSKPTVQTQLAVLALNIAYGSEDGNATVKDPVANDWPTLNDLVTRVSAAQGPSADPYKSILERLNANNEPITPSTPEACGK
jgi:hypothetical protein